MSREQADRIVKLAVSTYLPDLETKPVGLPFEQVYHLDTVQPSQAWVDVYHRVKGTLSNWGLPLG